MRRHAEHESWLIVNNNKSRDLKKNSNEDDISDGSGDDGDDNGHNDHNDNVRTNLHGKLSGTAPFKQCA